MNNRLTQTLLVLTSMASPLLARGQDPDGASMKTLQAVRTDDPITLDGRLDERRLKLIRRLYLDLKRRTPHLVEIEQKAGCSDADDNQAKANTNRSGAVNIGN